MNININYNKTLVNFVIKSKIINIIYVASIIKFEIFLLFSWSIVFEQLNKFYRKFNVQLMYEYTMYNVSYVVYVLTTKEMWITLFSY